MNSYNEIRDWYAGQALMGILANPQQQDNVTRDPLNVVVAAFNYADAMMDVRKERIEKSQRSDCADQLANPS